MKKTIIFILCFFISNSTLKSQEIDSCDTQKYKDALLHILNDTTIKGSIYVSDIVADLHRPLCEEIGEANCKYKKTLDSLNFKKYTWFEDFHSPLIEEIFKEHNRYLWYREKGNILFFSTIEKNTLAAEVFIDMDRGQLNKLTFKRSHRFWGRPVYSYLFFFDCLGKIEDVFRITVIYE